MIVTVSGWVAVCAGFPESVTLIVNVKVLAVVGVPLMAPLEEFRVKPFGSDPLLTEKV
jgi:hypothetical protein